MKRQTIRYAKVRVKKEDLEYIKGENVGVFYGLNVPPHKFDVAPISIFTNRYGITLL